MQGLELNPPLVATMILLPVHEQPLSPPHPPGPAHEFLEPKDTTGQARRMAAISSGTCVGQQIRSRVVSASASNTSVVIPSYQYVIQDTVGYIMVLTFTSYIGSTTGGLSGISYVICIVCFVCTYIG